MFKERKLQIGNHLEGFRDLDHPNDHVRYLLPDQEEHAKIQIYPNAETGRLEIRATHGSIVVRPKFSNSIEVESVPHFSTPETKEEGDPVADELCPDCRFEVRNCHCAKEA